MKDFPIVYLNSNDGSGLLAFGEGPVVKANTGSALSELYQFTKDHKDNYMFGYLGYDLKNEIENLSSENKDEHNFPDLFFYVPKYVVELKSENLKFLSGERDSEALDFVVEFLEKEIAAQYPKQEINFQSRITKEEYLQKVKDLQGHIQKGDIYEVTFCQEYFAENVDLIDPLGEYFKMNNVTRAPFSSYMQFDGNYILCGSPERFLQKTGDDLVSQPIKGTSKRGVNQEEDVRLRDLLTKDPKEKAENVMIVDLVRNDLSKVAKKGSVNVQELFGIYSFETVHQLISTIHADQKEGTTIVELLKALFPMGSMTGAPKISAMELIEEFESFKRGVYSGAIGYIKPNGDFDFNVVIRSILYSKENRYLSCPVGGAITINSDPEKEYEECITKVDGIMKALNNIGG